MLRRLPRRRSLLGPLAAAVLLSTACGSAEDTTAPEEELPILLPDTPAPPAASPARAVIDRTLAIALPDYVPSRAATLAQADLLMFQLRALHSADGAENVRQIRALNPDVVIIGSIQLLTIFPHWNDSYHRDRMTLGAALWDAIHRRPAYTTTGAVAPMWDGMSMMNPMRDGRLDEAMLDDVVDAFYDHFARYPGIADGIMHDYTSESPWIYPSPEIANIGEVDLDGDGIGYADDPAEHDAWIGWQEELFRRLQARIGPGLVQIANGRMAIERPSTMPLLAGAFFETFPTMTWWQAPRYGFERLDELTRGGGLTPRRGRTWNIISSPATGAVGDLPMRRVANLLYDGWYVRAETHGDSLAVPDQAPIDLGSALGPIESERLDDGSWRLTRPYSDGALWIEFTAAGAVRNHQVLPR